MTKSILKVQDLSVIYNVSVKSQGSFFKKNTPLYALNNISFDLKEKETLGIVGESGCGKSTLGKAILRLLDTQIQGKILYEGLDLYNLKSAELKKVRQFMQIIFQDPLASLNPKMLVKEIISEPLKIFYPKLNSAEVMDKVYKIMDKVGLARSTINRYPHEFSGGQCQRIGIARAMILNPKLLVCDEAVSALDVSIKAQIINLLEDLKQEFAMSMIFISHDLSVVKYISDRILVFYLGHLVEEGNSNDIYKNPKHPYTEALISSIPNPYEKNQDGRIILKGDIPSPLEVSVGCPLQNRCIYAQDKCKMVTPPLVSTGESNHKVSCFFPLNSNISQ